MEKTVLVADDDRHVTQALALRLKQLGLNVMRSPDATHALVGVQRIRPDLLILDVNMPGGNGLAVAEMLASDAEFRNVPVIIYTGRADQMTRARCAGSCRYYVQKSPDSWNQIKAIVCKELEIETNFPRTETTTAPSAEPALPEVITAATTDETLDSATETETVPLADLKGPSAGGPPADDIPIKDSLQPSTPAVEAHKQAKLLCIDDDPDISKSLKMRLAAYNIEVLRALNGLQGYWTAVGERPDVIICDLCMPENDGNNIISRLKSHSFTQNVPVIVLTGQRNPNFKRTMLSLGVEAYLLKPLDFDELLRALRAHLDLPKEATGCDQEQLADCVSTMETDSAKMAEAP